MFTRLQTTLVTLLGLGYFAFCGGGASGQDGLTPADSSSPSFDSGVGLGFSAFGGFGGFGGYGVETETDRLLAPAKLRALQLENVRKRILNRRERLINQRHRMANRWAAQELKSFERYVFQLARDERVLRRNQDQLRKLKRELTRFLNGASARQGRATLGRLRTLVEQTPELAHALQVPVPMLPASEFRPDPRARLTRVLRPGGVLVSPPLSLVGSVENSRLVRARTAFQNAWRMTISLLQSDEEITAGVQLHLADRLTDWKQVAAETISPQATRQDRLQARRYFDDLRRMVDRLKTPRLRERLKRHVMGYQFTGGTVGDLIEFVTVNRVQLQFGGRAQLALSNLGNMWLKRADQQLAVMAQRIEAYKRQNPSHEAVLKQWLVQNQPQPPIQDDVMKNANFADLRP